VYNEASVLYSVAVQVDLLKCLENKKGLWAYGVLSLLGESLQCNQEQGFLSAMANGLSILVSLVGFRRGRGTK